MTEGVKGIPDNWSVVIPRLFCRDVRAEIDFCKNTFEAVELNRRPGPDGELAHALLTIGPAMIMIEAEWPQLASRAPTLSFSGIIRLGKDGLCQNNEVAANSCRVPSTC